ncbi:MAG TPA: VCBS repeat-containing protein, partial [Planctomycetota bacterium]|nr:VCBS repeat-containing protein [Planctomycetota bacterium]
MVHEALRSLPAVAIGAAFLLADAAAQLPTLAQPIPSPTAQPGSGFGVALAIGDVNADGFRDLIAGAGTDDTAGPDAGSVFVFLGPGLSSVLTLLQPVPEPGAAFGSSVAVGDVNGDGIDDLLVGAGLTDMGTAANAGAAFVFFGPGLTSFLPLAQPVPEAGAFFGGALAAGDIDGDGIGDVVVGAYGVDAGPVQQNAGAAFVFVGPGLGTVLPLADPTPEYDARFGSAVAAGDVDGDGFGDVLVGEYYADQGLLFNAGQVFAFLGPGLTTVLPLADPTPVDYGAFGYSLAAGDLDGDGLDDLVVGSPLSWVAGIPSAGEALVFLGPGLTTVLPLAQPVPAANAQFGTSVAIGDVDGDLSMDVVIGARLANAGGVAGAGETFVLLGPGFSSSLPLLDPTPETYGGFGRACAAGDVNGDGAADVAVGALDPGPLGTPSGGEAFLFVPQFDLGLNSLSVSASAGGTVAFTLQAGPVNAGRPFLLVP